MSRIIYFIRHGETESNVNHTAQPFDDPLTDTGRRQAARVATRAQGLSFETLLASDMPRAAETAAAIAAATKQTIISEPLFREVRRPTSFTDSMISRNSETYQNFMADYIANMANPAWRYEDAETFFDLIERADAAALRLKEIAGDTLVVSHGMFIRFLILRLIFEDALTPAVWAKVQYRFLTTNTGISAIRWHEQTGGWSLLTFNDFAHFAE